MAGQETDSPPADYIDAEVKEEIVTVVEELPKESATPRPPVAEVEQKVEMTETEIQQDTELKMLINGKLPDGVTRDPEEIVAVILECKADSKEFPFTKRFYLSEDTLGRHEKSKEVEAPSFSLRWDGKPYMFTRGKRTKVPIMAAKLFLGGPAILGVLGIKVYNAAEADREARRLKNRFSAYGPFPLVLVGVEYAKSKNAPLPEGTIRVG